MSKVTLYYCCFKDQLGAEMGFWTQLHLHYMSDSDLVDASQHSRLHFAKLDFWLFD